MKSKRPLLLALFLLLAAGLWGLTGLLDTGPADSMSGLDPITTEVPPAPPSAPGDISLAEEEVAVLAPTEERADAGAGLIGSENFDLQGALWIEGKVHSSRGIPADEQAEILAVILPDEAHDVEGMGRLMRQLNLDHPDPKRVVEELQKIESARWSRRPMEADGSFKIPVPSDGFLLRALIDARYLYMEEAFTVSISVQSDPPEAVVLEADTGAWITGTCSPPEGHPSQTLGKIEAALTGTPEEASSGFRSLFSWGAKYSRKQDVAETETFEFRALPPDLIYQLALTSEECLDVSERSITVSSGEHRHMDTQFDMGSRISGRVLDEAGTPIEGARVQLGGVLGGMAAMVSPRMGLGRVNSKTDEDGVFFLKGASPKPAKLSTFKKGYLLEETEELQLAEGTVLTDVEIVLDSGYHVAGTILWPDGTPASKARVRARTEKRSTGFDMGSMLGTQNGSGSTDAEGNFELTGLSEGPFTVTASAVPPRDNVPEEEEPDHRHDEISEEIPEQLAEFVEDLSDDEDGDQPRWRTRRANVPKNTLNLVLVLEEPTGISGHVVDDLGAPITTFRVEAERQDGNTTPWGGRRSVDASFEDENGAFFLEGLDAGRWTISASANGYSEPQGDLQVTTPHAGPSLQVVLPRASRASGMVFDPLGVPVEAASVRAHAGSGRGPRWSSRSTETEPDGSFSLGNLGVGALTLTASAEGWAGSLPLTLDLAPAGSVDDVVLTLRLGGTLTGEVFGADGKPEANRGIQLIGSRGGGQDDIITDAKGWFEITHLTPGKYQVMAEPSSEAVLGMMESGDTPDIGAIFSSLKMASAEVFEGETTHVVLGEEPKNPVQVSGHVTEAGEPVGGVMVAAISEGGNVLSGLAMSQTKPDGSYKLKLKRPGPTVFSVQAFRTMDIQFFADVPEAETFIFDMAMPLGTITGTVYGPKGSPVAGVPMLVSQGGGVFSLGDMNGNRSRVQTDEKGDYILSHLTPGTYTIRAGGPGTGFGNDSAPYGLSIHSDVVVRKDERTSGVDLTLGGAARILGSVMDADGNTVAQAAIFVYDDQGHVLSPISMCNSDSRGRFIYSGISPGTYTVAAVLNGTCSPTSAPVRVDLGTEPEVHLRLDAGTTLVVILEDREGNAVRARVRVVDAAGREVGTRMSADRLADLLGEGFSTREQRFGPLPPGKYRVIATAEDGRGANKPVTIKGQDERKVKLRLK